MKRFLFITVASCLMMSCADSLSEDFSSQKDNKYYQNEKLSNSVNLSDVVAINKASHPNTRSEEEILSGIQCLRNENNDTLFYVVQEPEGGWTMYASDTRVPAVIAQSEEGNFEELMKVDPIRVWISAMMEDMQYVKQSKDNELNFSIEEINHNREYWEAILTPDEFVKEKIGLPTPLGFEPPDKEPTPNPTIPPGHYELNMTYSYTETLDSVTRLTTTNWYQFGNFNMYCPKLREKKHNSWNAPAGCVPIAAAQMLYFLNRKFGVPEEAPSFAYINSYVDEDEYNWNQDLFMSSVWRQILLNIKSNDIKTQGSLAAPLIAHIGKLLNIHYTDSTAPAPTRDLPDKVFKEYKISCVYENKFNTDKLKSSLMSGMPVIISAHDKNVKDSGHCFIADSYKTTRRVTVNSYVWVYDNPSGLLPNVPEKVEYEYSTAVISYIGFNWGWEAIYNLGGTKGQWFSITDDWLIKTDKENNYNTKDGIIYGFAPL